MRSCIYSKIMRASVFQESSNSNRRKSSCKDIGSKRYECLFRTRVKNEIVVCQSNEMMLLEGLVESDAEIG